MEKGLTNVHVPEDWIGDQVMVLTHGMGEAMLPEDGMPLVVELYRGELRTVGRWGISLSAGRREETEGSLYPGGDTFFPWGAVLRISLIS